MRTGQFHTKVVGVTHENTDGSHRQQIVRRCQVGEAVRFCPEPWNEYDRNAIAVQRLTGEQLGYLSRELAADLAVRLAGGEEFSGSICGVNADEGNSLGVNLLVKWRRPNTVATQHRAPTAEETYELDFLEGLSPRDISRIENRKPGTS